MRRRRRDSRRRSGCCRGGGRCSTSTVPPRAAAARRSGSPGRSRRRRGRARRCRAVPPAGGRGPRSRGTRTRRGAAPGRPSTITESLPSDSRARCVASSEPSASPSGLSWDVTTNRRCSRKAATTTALSDAASTASVSGGFIVVSVRGRRELVDEVRHANAVLDRAIVDELELRGPAQLELAVDRRLQDAGRALERRRAYFARCRSLPSTLTHTFAWARSRDVSTAVTVTNPIRGSLSVGIASERTCFIASSTRRMRSGRLTRATRPRAHELPLRRARARTPGRGASAPPRRGDARPRPPAA